MIQSWDELVTQVGARPGMWVGRARYSLVRSFVEGFGAAQDDEVLAGFQRWLGVQHPTVQNFAWPSWLLHEAFPDRDTLAPVAWALDDPENAGWRRPPDTPVSEDALSYPDDDAIAIEHLFRRLREYLSTRG